MESNPKKEETQKVGFHYVAKGVYSYGKNKSQQKKARMFLEEIGVSDWDIVAEVIEHILPKYRNSTHVIPRAEFNRDLSKIMKAYRTDSQTKKDHLQEKLMMTPFILTKDSHANNLIYFKPEQLYIGTKDVLWSENAIGTYSTVSVTKKVRQFLQKLDIPKWDIVEEVVETILPKYKRNPPKVPIKEHMKDFKKISLAYNTCGQYRKIQLKTELQKTQFILAENPRTSYIFYLKPDQLYSGTDGLKMYFEKNDLVEWVEIWEENNDDLTDLRESFGCDRLSGPTGAFVDLDKYPRVAHELFKDLGIADVVRVKRKEKDHQGHVIVVDRYGEHVRGLNGFDPGIAIDGLAFALDYPTPEKSAFIWNHIAVPNVDHIKGIVEKSTRQDYHNSSHENVLSAFFGDLLVNNAWLPDIDGNMHKPSEISLTELPESFQLDERLGNQLGMKKVGMAELAEEIGVPVEMIEEIRQNPEEYAEFKEWKAAKKALEQKEKEGREQPSNEPASHISLLSNVSTSSSRSSSQVGASHGGSGGGSSGHGGHGGGGPGEVHENLKNDLAHNPSQLGEGLRLVQEEYIFKSGDRVDILLMDSSGKPVTVEVKPHIPSGSDAEVLQALKYKHLAAADYGILCKEVRCILAAPEIPDDVKKKCRQLGIEPFMPTRENK